MLTQLASMRKQLQSERRRVENALENSKVFVVNIADYLLSPVCSRQFFIPQQNRCFHVYTGISLSVRPCVCLHKILVSVKALAGY